VPAEEADARRGGAALHDLAEDVIREAEAAPPRAGAVAAE
jgi:hypothetical protein